jgi:two-component system, cell cycle response regulator
MENVHVLKQNLPKSGDFLPFNSKHFSHEPSNLDKLNQKLQTTLNLNELINIFSEYAKKIINLSGLQFHSPFGVSQMPKSDNKHAPFSFELELEGEHLGQIVYFCKNTLCKNIKDKLHTLHNTLLYPLRNAIMYTRVLQLATKDALTGLSNRSDFNDNLSTKLERSRRHHRKFSLMLLDLDNFKHVNDSHGHKSGDHVLIEFSKILKHSIRATDSVYRFGGDEFAILIDDGEICTNEVISLRIMSAVHSNSMMKQYNVTTSIGYTLAESHDSCDDIFTRADQGLYKAKGAGRNCARVK